MSDADNKGPELKPLPHPELFNLDIDTSEPDGSDPPSSGSKATELPPPVPKASKPPPEPAPSDSTTSKQKTPGQPAWQRVLFAFAAFVVYALLIDMAVEAVLAESPIRWVVVGIVGGFLVLTGLLWRPTGWPMKAGLATLVFLGLLAGAIWDAGDVNQGLMVVRQPPLLVLTAVTGLLVAWGGIWMMTIRSVPWWSKLIVGLITVYGVSAFVLPLLAAAGLQNLLTYVDFLERLPFWLEGKFVSVLVLLPLTLLILLFTGITRVRGRQLWGWSGKVIAFSLGLFIAFQAFSDALPTFVAPGTETPAIEIPDVDVPEAETPAVPTPVNEESRTETPEAETPEIQAPETEAPAIPQPDAQLAPQDSTLSSTNL